MGLDNTPVTLSEQLLLNVKMGKPTHSLEILLAKFEISNLTTCLEDDKSKKAFWINTYNAFFQILSEREKKIKPDIFREKLISVAGKLFSLDDIEHGILRKYRWKYSLGYLPQLFPSPLIKQLAVSVIDFRIHFALNCGAKSCPPIAFYKAANIDEQLDLATKSFLESETFINETSMTVTVSRLMLWFKGDFGGKKGIRQILANCFNMNFKLYSIGYRNYDWSAELNKFAE
ncbi:MAG: DUF547 domain-containing protein [Ferruginibacter sp.]